jgi:hypothetical protein
MPAPPLRHPANTDIRPEGACEAEGQMPKAAYVISRLAGEGDQGHASFTIKYGDGKQAELELSGLPKVPEGEHSETKLALYELMEALDAWRNDNGPIHPL